MKRQLFVGNIATRLTSLVKLVAGFLIKDIELFDLLVGVLALDVLSFHLLGLERFGLRKCLILEIRVAVLIRLDLGEVNTVP